MTKQDLRVLQSRVNAHFRDPQNMADFNRRLKDGREKAAAVAENLKRISRISPELRHRPMTI